MLNLHISSVLYVAVHGRIVGIVGIVGSVRGLALRIVAERGAIELRLVKLGMEGASGAGAACGVAGAAGVYWAAGAAGIAGAAY